jgi:hypothetical protein
MKDADLILSAFADCRQSVAVGAFVNPVGFAQGLSFRHDVSARQEFLDLELTPYLRPVLEACDFIGKGAREITVVAPEQTGKSLTWQVSLLWSFLHAPGLSLVVYPSDDKADEVNRAKLLPLMRGIDILAAELDLPKTKAKNRYNFGGFISYFQGSGERISAHAAQIRIADELDDWIEHEGHAAKLDDLRKRGRSFDDSLLLKVSSPKGEKSAIWREFENSNQQYWHLRCQGCGGLTIRSCDVHHLQFEYRAAEDGGERVLVPGSERLICPACKYQHFEHQKRDMNLQGGFVAKVPERVEHLGFQWGALASQWPSLGWRAIAEAQLRAGKSANMAEQVYFDNSIRGRPFRPRKLMKDLHEGLIEHCRVESLDPATIEAVFLTADTQDKCWKWELRGLGIDSGHYQLAFGTAETADALEKIMLDGWQGLPVVMALIDEGGHRKADVSQFVQKHPRAFAYKGDGRQMLPWQFSKSQAKLILARRDHYQDQLLYHLYYQGNKENNYWWLLDKDALNDEYFAEVAAVRAMPNKREGHLRKNWDHEGRTHDYFDTGMMYFTLLDIAATLLEETEFKHNAAEYLIRAREAAADEPAPDTAEPPAQGGSGRAWVKTWGMK